MQCTSFHIEWDEFVPYEVSNEAGLSFNISYKDGSGGSETGQLIQEPIL